MKKGKKKHKNNGRGFEMKKSCPAKESKVVTTEDTENVLSVSKEDSKEQLTEEQLLINQKLLESGIDDEGLGWLEKRNIFKTINVSLDTAGSERLQRSSPRLAKAIIPKPGKWIENSFENLKAEDEKSPKTKSNKKDSESTSCCKKSTPTVTSNRENQETEESDQKSNHKVDCERSQRDGEIKSGDTPKSSRKVHYVKIHVEGREECNSQTDGEGNSGQEVCLGKKRASQPEIETTEAPKKLKMEETNNGIESEEETPVRAEPEMERRKPSAPFKIRNIKTILSECEIRNKNWKETYSKCKCPTRWGRPIVGTCSEKWDGKQIPPKLLHRYQKYLLSNNLTHPVFFPVKSPGSVDLNKLVCDISSQSGGITNSECRDESETDYKHLGEGSFTQGDSTGSGSENNLNTSGSARDTSGRMVLRNRPQQKTVISDDEDVSSDDSDDWQAKQKSSKKQKTNAKNKKAAEQSNKQLVLKLERCNLNKGNGNEGGRKNGNKNDVGFTGGSAMMSPNSMNQAGINTKSLSDPDTMVCPICSLRFKKQHIESHATECASKTYKD